MIELIGNALTKGYGRDEAFKEMQDVSNMVERLRRESNNDSELNNILKKETGIRSLAANEIIKLISKAFTTKVGLNNVDCRELLMVVLRSNNNNFDASDFIRAGEKRIGNTSNTTEVTQRSIYELTKTSIILKLIVIFTSGFNDNFSINDVNKIYNAGTKSADLLVTCMEVYADKLIATCMN